MAAGDMSQAAREECNRVRHSNIANWSYLQGLVDTASKATGSGPLVPRKQTWRRGPWCLRCVTACFKMFWKIVWLPLGRFMYLSAGAGTPHEVSASAREGTDIPRSGTRNPSASPVKELQPSLPLRLGTK